ncbi:MAG: alpha/beta hydrolase [Alteromonadaceae bacterium]|nr:alpha/beta hydrolase [Alteromonadaceae bacterium]|tara:strand:+ start:495 stop:1301 length:807 start_codon:yes stop_codon:yes gene_type:complete
MALALYSRISGPVAEPGTSQAKDPVVLLHGVFGSLENLGVVERKLAETMAVHSLDLRNHGRSPHADTMSYREMAEDVLDYLDRQGIGKAAIVGHSMGGKVGMRLALDAPERVSRLIVADIAPVDYEPHHEAILDGLQALDAARLASRAEADKVLQDFVQEAGVRQFLLKNLVRDDQGAFVLRLNLKAILENYDDIVAGQESDSAFNEPVLFIKGGSSNYIGEQHRDKVSRLFPNSTLRVIPGVGHWLHAEKPELFTNLCERFLTGELD